LDIKCSPINEQISESRHGFSISENFFVKNKGGRQLVRPHHKSSGGCRAVPFAAVAFAAAANLVDRAGRIVNIGTQIKDVRDVALRLKDLVVVGPKFIGALIEVDTLAVEIFMGITE